MTRLALILCFAALLATARPTTPTGKPMAVHINAAIVAPPAPTEQIVLVWRPNYMTNSAGQEIYGTNEFTGILVCTNVAIPRSQWTTAFKGHTNTCTVTEPWALSYFFRAYNNTNQAAPGFTNQ